MADAYLPRNWPAGVSPPGSEDFELTASAWLIEQVPDLRTHPVRRYPVALAAIASHILKGAVEGARDGYRTARTELGEQVPPHAVDAALTAYRDEGRRLAAAAQSAELLGLALRGEPLPRPF
jgi:hypothetical protein